MPWSIDFTEDFRKEFLSYPKIVQAEIVALLELLAENGPQLGRPHADTLSGSGHKNMKELRCRGKCGAWRVAFAFTPDRRALVLAGGKKSRGKEGRFYRKLLRKADARFDEYLADAAEGEGTEYGNT